MDIQEGIRLALTSRKMRFKYTFPLGKLPFLALKEVIRNMDIQEGIRLALTSRKMRLNVKYSRLSVGSPIVRIHDEFSNVEMKEDVFLFNGFKIYKKANNSKEDKYIKRSELEPWLNPTLSTLQNTQNILVQIQNTFKCDKFVLVIDLRCIKTTIKDVLSISDFQNFETLNLYKGKLDEEDMNCLMENAKADQDLHIYAEVPENYYHKNMLKFYDIVYEDARFVKIEHLLTIKDNYIIDLGKNNLTLSDINTFLKYWINSECDLFKMMTIKTTEETGEETEANLDILFDGLIVLKGFRFGCASWLCAAKSVESRKTPILCFEWYEDEISLFAHSIEERPKWIRSDNPMNEDRLEEDEPYEPEFEILKVLEKKKDLEETMRIEENNERKLETENEIEELDLQLLEKGVRMEQGRHVFGSV
ncbi:hypothetical protein GCK72_000863 [Caenorhabditis remanei]|uniref:F-box domain-containing protein n=1 Tax=Caenorhabditis remanei TaxID=31234 RepID=A0A6A5HLH7_CAERE|nr:hypothetical protein GCK72_000863 [Caenorhabditis remanei]KAF1769050.1 hypothetical protein GCK72_000863 [Caenorhabditis remanei]